jgi:DNA sulfur modification protein DndD
LILKRLTLRDFGTYAGEQSFDLTPNGKRNIILIGGKNGSGKSTFLEAVRLCFYGRFASRFGLRQDKYERYLLDRIHRDPSTLLPTRSASVEVEFDYGDQDGIRTYAAVRQWERTASGGVSEQFGLSCDGNPVTDIDPTHWQDFVQELIPIGVSDLFFFDGEKVQLLAEDDSDKKTLSDAVRDLLGTDIIEKLNADLNIYRSRAVQRAASEDQAAQELANLSNEAESQRTRRDLLKKQVESADAIVAALVSDVQTLEQHLQEQGGAYAKNRGRLGERRRQIGLRVAALEQVVRDHAHGLLPIALAPRLVKSLLEQLAAEADMRVGVIVDDTLTSAAKATLAQLRNIKIKRDGKNVSFGTLAEFVEVSAVIKKTHASKFGQDDLSILHDLSHEQEKQVRAWAHTALDSLPGILHTATGELEALYREQQKVERDLARAPQDDVLQPLIEQLGEARKRLADASVDAGSRRAELEQASVALSQTESVYLKTVSTLASNNLQRVSLEKAARVQVALVEFKDALITRKIKELETAVTWSFNLLSRKRVQRSININPTTFQVSMKDSHSRLVPKSELSSGEKQIYAISVLWALARVSARPLPMIIDTPLARLDRDHRALLGQRYFPNASHQVIILSTDSEIDQEFIPLLGESIARTYELVFDVGSQSTLVRQGYFEEVKEYAIH